MPGEGQRDPENTGDVPLDVEFDNDGAEPVLLQSNDPGVISVVSAIVPGAAIDTGSGRVLGPKPSAPFTSAVSSITAAHDHHPAPPRSSNSGLVPAVIRSGNEELATFGRYRLHQRLAMGGMAQLFLASIDGPDGFSKQCVVKTILPEFASLPDFNNMFVTEAKVTAMLHHPNIVEIYDFGREQGRYFIAMEYVRGCSLHQLLREAGRANMTLGPGIAVSIGTQMCDALAYAQSLRGADGSPINLVHRDLSAGNILISATGMAKLTDFGIVKSDLNLNSTATGVVKGKYPYMSPEQIRGEPVDQRSDIFSLGTVIYEVSTGVSLFKRKSLADTINAVARAEVKRPSEVVPAYPPQLENILMRALSLRREDRFQTFNELGAALDAFRLSANLTNSTRELVSLVQTLFPGGVAPGAYQTTSSGVIPSPETIQAPTAGPTRTKFEAAPAQMGSSSGPSYVPQPIAFGALEVTLAAIAVLLVGLVVWLIA